MFVFFLIPALIPEIRAFFQSDKFKYYLSDRHHNSDIIYKQVFNRVINTRTMRMRTTLTREKEPPLPLIFDGK